MQFGYAVQPLEHGHVRIGAKIIFIDMWIGKPRDHLVVAGVGKSKLISYPRDAFLFLIAKYLPLTCDHFPNEGEHCFSALGRSWSPEITAQGVDVLYASVFLVHERIIRAFEDLLPPQPIRYDQNNIACLEFNCGFSLASNVDPERQGNK